MEQQATETINKRYYLRHRLGKGGMGAVFLAFDRLNRHNIALKRVLGLGEEDGSGNITTDATMNTRLLLAHEFQTLASLHHPHIIRVLDYGFDSEKQPFFTMNVLEGGQPLTEYGQGKSLDEQIELILQTLQALAYLHRRNLIHRDLKPENALVTQDGAVKVLDFGLATEQTGIEEAEVAGTIAYMAPEVLQGSPVSNASDLYAVGVMAYELIAGHHPFSADNPGMLIQEIFFSEPDIDELDVPGSLANVIARLMMKEPDFRYDDAGEVIEEISRALDQPVPEETAAIRESYLQAAEFVGREKEMAHLQDALAHAIKGRGSMWLIGGESGVGKTRLLNEVRTQAMVRGALMLHGQAVAEGGLAYQMWRDPLRRLVLSVDLEENDASVLKQIIPDIGELLERDIPDAPEMTGAAGHNRLMEMIGTIFRRIEEPALLVLEDLQWVGESLDVLKHLSSLVSDLPLLIVCNYRNDEAPDLPEQLADAETIILERFDESGIEQLSASMLGKVGTNPGILDLLKRETEGNVFFLIEVVRALAEDAGSLQRIGMMTLPANIFAGGVQQVVQRRLKHIPEGDRALLRAAALFGRQLDTKLLQAIDPDCDMTAWLTAASNVMVLEATEETWRFAHDKLREGLLSEITGEERRELHIIIAEKLQEVYAENVDEYASTIASHYEDASQLRLAQYWYARAGQRGKDVHAIAVTVANYKKALELYDQIEDPIQDNESVPYFRSLDDYAEALVMSGDSETAIRYWNQLYDLAKEQDDIEFQALALIRIAEMSTTSGQIDEAMSNLDVAESLVRDTDLEKLLAHLLFQKAFSMLLSGKFDAAQEYGEEVLRIANYLELPQTIAQCSDLMGIISSYTGQYVAAEEYFSVAVKIQEEIGARTKAAYTTNNIGFLHYMRGNYAVAVDYYVKGIALAQEVGNKITEVLLRGNRAGANVCLGKYDEAVNEFEEIMDFVVATEMTIQSEFKRFWAEAFLGQGKPQEALEMAREALELGMKFKNPEYIGAGWRVLGMVMAELGGDIEMEIDGQNQKIHALTCFAEGERVLTESGMQLEHAHTLKRWALYELKLGHDEVALEKWQQARKIFGELGADKEYERMPEEPDRSEL